MGWEYNGASGEFNILLFKKKKKKNQHASCDRLRTYGLVSPLTKNEQ
jgi:hypothetical protein